ncbi:hypothetical protein A2Y85_00500 [candidate division WOR-3 bacterium RBG_13_43_14]|uniref:Transporter n=1 Tax=candidate division WOR-3 bacterium RBG_13_43_14 TaxID=1802590 RepID=A0A1F4U8S5_UNCW3|nr:MAG: hypothetical protein A2Y85_00500 [candidate division WOR-3 bacterium RBG_13_43_14]
MLIFLLFTQVDTVSLNEAIDKAMSGPVYNEARVDLEKNRIIFYQALTSVLPTTGALVRYTRTEPASGPDTDTYSGSLTFTMPLLDFDVFSSIIAARRQLRLSKVQKDANVAGLILKVKTAYYNLINAYELLESSDIAIKRAEENQKLIDMKYELGSASRLEQLQSEVFYLRALQDQAKAQTIQVITREELKALCGINTDIYPFDSLVEPDSIEFAEIDSLIEKLIKVNYALIIAKNTKSLAKLNVTSAYLGFLPNVSLFYGYNYSEDSLIFDFQHWQDNSSRNYGISVSLPIFEIKGLIFNMLRARKDYQAQAYAYQRTQLETQKSLHATYSSLQEVYASVRFSRKSLDAASEAIYIAREQYALGIISLLELLSAEKDYYEAKVSYSSTLSNFYVQKANLSYLLGELVFNKE